MMNQTTCSVQRYSKDAKLKVFRRWLIFSDDTRLDIAVFILSIVLWSLTIYYSFFDDFRASIIAYLSTLLIVLMTKYTCFEAFVMNSTVIKIVDISSKFLTTIGICLALSQSFWNTSFYSICAGILMQKMKLEMQQRENFPMILSEQRTQINMKSMLTEYSKKVDGLNETSQENSDNCPEKFRSLQNFSDLELPFDSQSSKNKINQLSIYKQNENSQVKRKCSADWQKRKRSPKTFQRSWLLRSTQELLNTAFITRHNSERSLKSLRSWLLRNKDELLNKSVTDGGQKSRRSSKTLQSRQLQNKPKLLHTSTSVEGHKTKQSPKTLQKGLHENIHELLEESFTVEKPKSNRSSKTLQSKLLQNTHELPNTNLTVEGQKSERSSETLQSRQLQNTRQLLNTSFKYLPENLEDNEDISSCSIQELQRKCFLDYFDKDGKTTSQMSENSKMDQELVLENKLGITRKNFDLSKLDKEAEDKCLETREIQMALDAFDEVKSNPDMITDNDEKMGKSVDNLKENRAFDTERHLFRFNTGSEHSAVSTPKRTYPCGKDSKQNVYDKPRHIKEKDLINMQNGHFDADKKDLSCDCDEIYFVHEQESKFLNSKEIILSSTHNPSEMFSEAEKTTNSIEEQEWLVSSTNSSYFDSEHAILDNSTHEKIINLVLQLEEKNGITFLRETGSISIKDLKMSPKHCTSDETFSNGLQRTEIQFPVCSAEKLIKDEHQEAALVISHESCTGLDFEHGESSERNEASLNCAKSNKETDIDVYQTEMPCLQTISNVEDAVNRIDLSFIYAVGFNISC